MIISIFEKNKYVILLALFLKDLKLWAFANVITLTIPILFIVTIYFVITRYFDVFEMTECAYLIARIGVFMPLFYGEFILEREFKNGTYIFMRTVPISDRFLHLEKIIFSFIMVAISEIPALIFLLLYFDNYPKMIYYIILTSLLLFATSMTIFLILKVGLKITFLTTNIGISVLILAWKKLGEYYPDWVAQIVANYLLQFIGSALLLLAAYIFFELGVFHFKNRDTRELVS